MFDNLTLRGGRDRRWDPKALHHKRIGRAVFPDAEVPARELFYAHQGGGKVSVRFDSVDIFRDSLPEGMKVVGSDDLGS